MTSRTTNGFTRSPLALPLIESLIPDLLCAVRHFPLTTVNYLFTIRFVIRSFASSETARFFATGKVAADSIGDTDARGDAVDPTKRGPDN